MVKHRDKTKKRNAILDAAVDAFQELGFDRASMDFIAEKADASKRTVYNHFASKELLFNAVIARFMDESAEQKHIEYNPQQPIEAQLGRFVDLKIGVAASPEQLSFMRMAFGVILTHPDIAAQMMQKVDEPEDGFHLWLEAACNDGKLCIDDIPIAAEVFWSMCSSTFFWMPMLQGEVNGEYAEKMKAEFIGTFLAKYKASQAS